MFDITLRRAGLLAAIAALPTLAAAQESGPPPFPEFTFKRVGLPQGGAKRIQIQIEPEAPAPAAPVSADRDGTPAAPSLPAPILAFWEAFEAAPADLPTLRRAVSAVDSADIPSPRLPVLAGIASAHGRTLMAQSIASGVSPALALAVISVESSGQGAAVSSAGAEGLMQLMPATAERFGVTDSFDAAQNIRGGMAYLGWLLERFEGDPVLALAGYNAGEGAVERAGGVPDYAETRGYVPKVVAAWSVARALCATPPELVTDGCVFALPG